MTASTSQRGRVQRNFRLLVAVFATALCAIGLSATALELTSSAASATTVSFSQCNNRAAGPGGAALSVTCSVDIVNNITPTGATSSSTFIRVCTLNACTGDTMNSSDVINAVHQCNGSDNIGGSTTVCSVNIVNNISGSAPAAATALTLSQCIGSGGGGGTLMTACIPSSQASPTVTQCNGSGTGGGGAMTCTASGTTSTAFPVAVDQCNGSENGGGSFVTCTTTMATNIVDTTPSGVGGGLPAGGTPGSGLPGIPTGFGVPGAPVTPPVAVTPPYTG